MFPDRESSILHRGDSGGNIRLYSLSVGIATLNRRLNLDYPLSGIELADDSFKRVARSCRGAWEGARDARVDPGELPLNITNDLRILPRKGKMGVTAGSPEVGTRGKRYHHNNATLKRVA